MGEEEEWGGGGDPKYLILVQLFTLLSCRRQNLVSGQDALDSCGGGCRKLRLHRGTILTPRVGVVGGCRKEDWGLGGKSPAAGQKHGLCSSPTQEQVFCHSLMRIVVVVEILSESQLWGGPGRKAVMGRSTSFGGVLGRCQM